MDLPQELTPERLFAWQAALENELEDRLILHAEAALTDIRTLALESSLSAAFARQRWERAVDDTMAELGLADQQVRAGLIDTDLGDQAYDTVQRVLALRGGQLREVTRDELAAALTEALELDTPSLVAAGAPREDGWLSTLLRPAKKIGQSWRARIKRQVRSSFTGLTGRLVLAELARRGHRFKQWASRKDDAVRHTHLEADGQTVPLNSPFRVGREYLPFPGAESGSLEETINCRCVVVPGDAGRKALR